MESRIVEMLFAAAAIAVAPNALIAVTEMMRRYLGRR